MENGMENSNGQTKSSWVPLLVLVIIIVAAFLWYNASKKSPSQQSAVTTVTTAPTAMMAHKMEVKLDQQNASGQTGTAELTEENGKVMVVFTLTGAPKTAEPAHIHMGSCPKPGAIAYPLSDVVNGKSETTISATLADLVKKEPLAINVHQSGTASGIKVYVACGDLSKEAISK